MNIIVKCLGCGFEDKLENFHALCELQEDYQYLSIVCPRCGDYTFFQHFHLPLPKMTAGLSLSHLLAAPKTEYPTYTDSQNYVNKRIAELRLKPILEIQAKIAGAQL